MRRANATMSRRQAEAERQLDAKINHERERLRKEVHDQMLEEADANAILDHTRDWQEDMEEKQYESYMKQFAVQTGDQVNGANAKAASKADEGDDKKLATVAKVVEDKKADKVAEKVVAQEAKKEEKKDAKQATAVSTEKKVPVAPAINEQKLPKAMDQADSKTAAPRKEADDSNSKKKTTTVTKTEPTPQTTTKTSKQAPMSMAQTTTE